MNLLPKSILIDISFFNGFLRLAHSRYFFEELQRVGFHWVYTYHFQIKCFLFAVFNMSHLCFTIKQDICSTECKKYTVNPVNTPWAYTWTKGKVDGLHSGELINGGASFGRNNTSICNLLNLVLSFLSSRFCSNSQPQMVRIAFTW